MTDIKQILQDYINYYFGTRAVGHTATVLAGVEKTNAHVIIDSLRTAKRLGIKDYIILEECDRLRGLRKAIIWDNFALTILMQKSLNEIHFLEDANLKLAKKVMKLSAKTTKKKSKSKG